MQLDLFHHFMIVVVFPSILGDGFLRVRAAGVGCRLSVNINLQLGAQRKLASFRCELRLRMDPKYLRRYSLGFVVDCRRKLPKVRLFEHLREHDRFVGGR